MAKTVIDFSGVPKDIRTGGRASHVPEGDYLLKIVKGEKRRNKNDNGSHYSWRFTIAQGKYKGKTLYMVTSLKPDALWNLRNLIFAATGKNVAGKPAVSFEPESIEGMVVAGTTEDDEYEGKIKSVLVDIRPKSKLKPEGGDDDEDEEDEDDDEDEEEDEEEEDEDEEDEDEEEEEPAPVKKKARASSTKKKKRVEEDEEDLDDIDVDDI